jgi:hypothetical protein
MTRKTIIIVSTPEKVHPISDLKKACLIFGWKYNTLSKLKLPFEYKGYKIEKHKLL